MKNDHTALLVPEATLLPRLRRQVRARGLRVIRGRAADGTGVWAVVDHKTGAVTRTHADLDVVARALGALRPWERVGVSMQHRWAQCVK